MDAKQTAAAQLASLGGAVANLGKHHRGTGGENAERQLSLALAKAVSDGLMHYYMEKVGYQDPEELYDDPFYSTGVFERLQAWDCRNAIELFRDSLQVDLGAIGLFPKVQEFFLGLCDGDGQRRTKGEAMFAYLPPKPLEDHLAICAAFFESLP
jgi:hypothetical protein